MAPPDLLECASADNEELVGWIILSLAVTPRIALRPPQEGTARDEQKTPEFIVSVFWISFRLHQATVNGRTYDERRDAFLEALETFVPAAPLGWWDETTSFVVIRTEAEIDEIGTALKDAIDTGYDLFLVRNMNKQQARICGANDDIEIFDLMVTDSGRTYLRDIT